MTDRAETHRALDDTFQVAVVLKGLFGLAELIGGVLLLFVTGEALNNFVVKATRSELSGDPHDRVRPGVMWLVWREYVAHGAAAGSRRPVRSGR